MATVSTWQPARRLLGASGVRMFRASIAVVLVGAAAPPAAALSPGTHREILEAACAEAGLPYQFCRRAGRANFETDFREWTSMAAHAQREPGQARCTAADASAERLDGLGRSFVGAVAIADYETAADELGRALHTLQDECAHHGMTNHEHAFYSMAQTCGAGDVSPDVQPMAIACATARTREVMAHVAAALADADRDAMGYVCRDDRDGSTDFDCAEATLPSPVTGCQFLAEHKHWDGVDSTWDGAVVGAALFDAFVGGLAYAPASTSVCAGDEDAIDPPSPRADVTDRDVGCLLTDIGCLGRADDPLDGDDGDPYDDDDGAGCRGSRGGTGTLVAFLLVVFLIKIGRDRGDAR
jgi:hypothetical protein